MPKWNNVLQSSDEVYRIKRAAVLRAATQIFGRRGFHDTSLDHIAEALEVSKGTLYNYFSDKQEILFECHKMALDLGDLVFVFAESHSKNGLGRLRLFIRAYLCWLNDTFEGGGVVSDVTALRQSDRQAVIGRRDAVEKRLVSYFEQGVKDGSVRAVDPRLSVYTIMGAINSVQSWFDPKGRMTISEIAIGMSNVLLHGVATTDLVADVTMIPSLREFEISSRNASRAPTTGRASKSAAPGGTAKKTRKSRIEA